MHKNKLTESFRQALQKFGFSAIEIIAPGMGYFAGTPTVQDQSALLEFYYKNSVVQDGEDTMNVEISPDKKIIVGKFFEQERPTYIDCYNQRLAEVIGEGFKPYG